MGLYQFQIGPKSRSRETCDTSIRLCSTWLKFHFCCDGWPACSEEASIPERRLMLHFHSKCMILVSIVRHLLISVLELNAFRRIWECGKAVKSFKVVNYVDISIRKTFGGLSESIKSIQIHKRILYLKKKSSFKKARFAAHQNRSGEIRRNPLKSLQPSQ